MRIALLPSAYAPAVGGIEELTRRLADRLQSGGDEVEVWTIRHPATLPAKEMLDGVSVRRFTMPLPAGRPGHMAHFAATVGPAFQAASLACAQYRPDLLHVQGFSANGVYAAAVARRRHLPLVITLQGETVMDDNDIYERSLSLRVALRIALRRADAVTANSQFVLNDTVRRFGLAPGRGVVIPNGVELSGDAPGQHLDLPFERFVLGLGRVVPKKGFDLLLEAFSRLAADHPDVGLVIAGDGRARPELVHRAAALGLAHRVHLPGSLDRGGVAWAMANAALFVLPSRVEPFGIVVLEALRAGRPVVVSRHGGAPEIVRHGREGLVVDPFDAAALAGAISRLLDSPEEAADLADAGRARVAEFSWERVAANYRDTYIAVTSGARSEGQEPAPRLPSPLEGTGPIAQVPTGSRWLGRGRWEGRYRADPPPGRNGLTCG